MPEDEVAPAPAPAEEPKPTDEPPQTFSQDEVNRIVSDRLKREREKLGDVSDLKRKAEEYDRLAEAQKSELDKAVEKARKEASDATRAEITTDVNARLVKAAVRVAAAGKLADPEDAIRLLDLSEFDADDQGNVDDKVTAKAVDDLVKAKPYLAANGRRSVVDLDAGARTPAPSGEDMNHLLRQAAGRG